MNFPGNFPETFHVPSNTALQRKRQRIIPKVRLLPVGVLCLSQGGISYGAFPWKISHVFF